MNKTLRKAKVHEPQNKKMTILLIPFIICCIGAFICLAALVLSACFEAYDSMALSAALFTFFYALGYYFCNPREHSLQMFKFIHILFIVLFGVTTITLFICQPAAAKSIGLGIVILFLIGNSVWSLVLFSRHGETAIPVFKKITFYPLGVFVLYLFYVIEQCVIEALFAPSDESVLLSLTVAGQFLVPLAMFQEAKELWDASVNLPTADTAGNADERTPAKA